MIRTLLILCALALAGMGLGSRQLVLDLHAGLDTKEQSPLYLGVTLEQELDSISPVGKFFLVCDSTDVPLYYRQQVYTGVCLDSLCKPVRIALYWDVAANFLGFRTPASEPLTKTDHVPFTDYDYFVLYTLLNNPYSVLGDMQATDLVRKSSSALNEVDGSSGATSVVDKKSVVSGAIYTCYTLWHLVYAPEVLDYLRQNTAKKLAAVAPESVKNLKNTDPKGMASAELAWLLSAADSAHQLRKHKVQKALTQALDSLTPLQTLTINNYLARQVFLYPDIEDNLAASVNSDRTFARMINRELP